MPTGYWGIMSDVVEILRKEQPKKILEIGTGFGKWGVLIREYLEVYGQNKWKPSERFVTIDAIEVYEPYISPLHKYIYNNITIGDIGDLAPTLPKYDAIIMFDVLEHLQKRQAEQTLKTLMEKTNLFLLSVPLGKEALYHFDGENEKESHVSAWEYAELKDYPNCVFHKMYDNRPVNIGLFAYTPGLNSK